MATLACLFDLDGVLTATATIHAAAWQEMFDSYLKPRAQRLGTPFVAFDPATDYDTYVDGKSRAYGTASFLASRGIELPIGGPEDLAGAETITALGQAKNEILLRRIRHDGVQAYAGSVRYVRAVRKVGLLTAVVSSSANCTQILAAAGIAELFDIRIDGLSCQAPGLVEGLLDPFHRFDGGQV
ncbi:HAD family hydrolase [Arthrobacter sp. LAPM80]|uniref:HAD family hydrolase n=1 Tax=Arthrobacter sp. LAPM80 TaxID=3141788 RepID=UPI00398B0631